MKTFLAFVIVSGALWLTSCGADDGAGLPEELTQQRTAVQVEEDTTDQNLVSFLVPSKKNLPACSLERETQLGYVVEEDSFYVWATDGWLPAAIKGKDGENGRDGIDGAVGQKGDRGDQGPQGERGETGSAGRDGLDGSNGINGSDGSNGRSVGIRSRSLAAGDQCVAGGHAYEPYFLDDSSIAGDEAVVCNGQNGSNGVDGQNGSNGVDGQNGSNGVDGQNGSNGVDGQNGSNGSDGLSAGIRVQDVAAGGTCAAGGKSFQAFTDADADGAYDAGETLHGSAQVVCNGQNGVDGQNGSNGVDGQNGVDATFSPTINKMCVFNTSINPYVWWHINGTTQDTSRVDPFPREYEMFVWVMQNGGYTTLTISFMTKNPLMPARSAYSTVTSQLGGDTIQVFAYADIVTGSTGQNYGHHWVQYNRVTRKLRYAYNDQDITQTVRTNYRSVEWYVDDIDDAINCNDY